MAFPWEQFKATEDQQDKKSLPLPFLLCHRSKRNHASQDEKEVRFRENIVTIDKDRGLMN